MVVWNVYPISNEGRILLSLSSEGNGTHRSFVLQTTRSIVRAGGSLLSIEPGITHSFLLIGSLITLHFLKKILLLERTRVHIFDQRCYPRPYFPTFIFRDIGEHSSWGWHMTMSSWAYAGWFSRLLSIASDISGRTQNSNVGISG